MSPVFAVIGIVLMVGVLVVSITTALTARRAWTQNGDGNARRLFQVQIARLTMPLLSFVTIVAAGLLLGHNPAVGRFFGVLWGLVSGVLTVAVSYWLYLMIASRADDRRGLTPESDSISPEQASSN
jgi:hypothetical protein